MTKKVLAAAMAVGIMILSSVDVMAAEKFDPAFYAATYADVSAVFGTDANALYNHYITCGKNEGRKANAGAAGGEDVEGMSSAGTTAASTQLVPFKSLPHYKDLKDTLTEEEFEGIYNACVPSATALLEYDTYHRVEGISEVLTYLWTSGSVQYSASTPHCHNACGYLVHRAADCVGCTKTVGLYLDMLGIEWEHVTGQFGSGVWHHWCVATIDGQRYIVDPYTCIFTPETERYYHPASVYFN